MAVRAHTEKGGRYMREKGYAITDFDGTGMLEVQRVDKMGMYPDDEAAVRAAIADGIKVIPVDELPDSFDRRYLGWIDTRENRRAILEYCSGI